MAIKKSNQSINVILGLNMTKFQKGLRTAQARLKRFGKTMSRFGSSMTRSVTLPLLGAGIAGVKLASDLEKSFAKIENLVGVTGPVLESFKTKLKEISAETATSQKSLADALFVITSAGIRSAKAMDILAASAKSSQVGMGETEAIARGITGAMNSYAKAGLTAARSADIMMAIVREGNLVAEDLAPTLGRVTGMAAELGISFEELGANIATFTRLGVPTEEAVTGLRGVMAAILKPTKKAKDVMDGLSMSSSDLRKMVGREGLHGTLMFLVDALKDNDEGLSSLFGNVRALSNVLGTAGAQGESYKVILDSITNSTGMVDKAFENVSTTSAFKFDQAIVDLKNNAIELGVELLPLAVKIAEKLTAMAKAFRELSPTVKKTMVAVAGLAAALGPLAFMIGATSTSIANGIRLVGKAITKSNPLILAASVAVGLLVTAWSAFAVKKKLATSAVDDNTRELVKNQAKANLLLDTIKRSNVSQETRNKLINEFNLKFGKYAGNLSTEETSIDAIKDAQSRLNTVFKERIATMALEGVLKDKLEAAAKKKVEIMEQELLLTQALANEGSIDGFFPEGHEASAAEINSLAKISESGIALIKERLKTLKVELESMTLSAAELQASLLSILSPQTVDDTTTKGASTAVETLRELSEEMKDLDYWLENNNFGTLHFEVFGEEEVTDSLDRILAKMKEAAHQMRFAASIADLFGSSLQMAFQGAIENGESLWENLKNMLKQLTVKLLAAAAAALVLSIALSIIFPGGTPVAGQVLNGMDLFKGLFNQFSGLDAFDMATPLAAGGLAFGPTLALVGDNRNASIDPEVIAPLSKLKAMMGGGNGQNITVTGRLSGSDLLISNERAGRQRSRYRGF